MGLGSSEPQRRIYYLSPRMQDENKKICPHFKVQVREKDGSIRNAPDETSVSGYLLKIGHGQYEWPKQSGIMNPTIQIFLVDGDDIFKIEANVQSNSTRSIMNTIIGTRDFGVMKIRLFIKRENNQEFGGVYISNDDQKTQWKYNYETDIKPLIDEVPDPKVKGKTIKIYHKVDDLLARDWLELEPYIAERARKLGYDKPPSGGKGVRSDAPGLQDEVDNLTEEELAKTEDIVVPDDTNDLPF